MSARPNMKLYANQPYISPTVRSKLVDFLFKMLVRLKILPFVFVKAVRLFDRYCLKRIVLLDQAQLIITTCLWVAAKVNGGNNHFANMSTERRTDEVQSISDLGYGSGARFKGPTERYRLPKISELIRLCGLRCRYDASMFRDMELHLMAALEWRLTDPDIDEYMVYSHEYKVTRDEALEAKLEEFFAMKQFAAYASCFVYELAGFLPLEVAKVIVDVINETFLLREADFRFQTLNQLLLVDENVVDCKNHAEIKRHVVSAVCQAPLYLLQIFNTRGPQLLHLLLSAKNRPLDAVYLPSVLLGPSLTTSSVFSEYNYSYASPAPLETDAGKTSRRTPPGCPSYPLLFSNTNLMSVDSVSSAHDDYNYDPGLYGLSTPQSVNETLKRIEVNRQA